MPSGAWLDTRHELNDEQAQTRATSARPFAARPVSWRCAVPGSGRVFITDPIWPCERQLRTFVLASLSMQTLVDGKPRNGTSQIWWLEMSERGDEILSAGPLTGSARASDDHDALVERTPSVTVGPSGRLTLAYLTRARGETSWQLRLAALSIPRETGKPVIAAVPSRTDDDVPNGLLAMRPRSRPTGSPYSPGAGRRHQEVFAVAVDARGTPNDASSRAATRHRFRRSCGHACFHRDQVRRSALVLNGQERRWPARDKARVNEMTSRSD